MFCIPHIFDMSQRDDSFQLVCLFHRHRIVNVIWQCSNDNIGIIRTLYGYGRLVNYNQPDIEHQSLLDFFIHFWNDGHYVQSCFQNFNYLNNFKRIKLFIKAKIY